MNTVKYETDGPIAIVTIDRPEVRNAVDGPTAGRLADAFRRFDGDDDLAVAVLTGAGGCFCAGADLKGVSEKRGNRVEERGDGPMGPSPCGSMRFAAPSPPETAFRSAPAQKQPPVPVRTAARATDNNKKAVFTPSFFILLISPFIVSVSWFVDSKIYTAITSFALSFLMQKESSLFDDKN